MFCSEWSLVKSEKHYETVIPLRCKCWTCEECAPIRKAMLVHEAKSGKPNIFITLTSRRIARASPDAAARRLARAWRIIRAEFLRKHGRGSLPFLCVFEKTKLGWPHLHIIGRCRWIDQAWLSKRMDELTGSPITDVRRVLNRKDVEYYICKYLSKDPQRFIGTKRYWRSQDYLDPIRATLQQFYSLAESWSILKMHWRTHAEQLERRGLKVDWGRSEAVVQWSVPP